MALDGWSIAGLAESAASRSTAFQLVALPTLMGITAGAANIRVAMIDGPVTSDHPDLTIENIRVLSRRFSTTYIKPGSFACVHGTQVAGILHARRESIVPGICPGCTLMVRPIFSDETTHPKRNGVPNAAVEELAVAIHEVVENGARVINLSVGLAELSSCSEHALKQAFDHAAQRGVIVIGAAGNQGTLGSSAITRHPWVVPVVACDHYGHVLQLSNLSASIGRNGLTAPGYNITSLAASGGHASFTGSSAAVPFVAGTVALLWSIFPSASAAQIRLAIRGGIARRRSVNPPLLDARAAYRTIALAIGGSLPHV